MHPKHRWLPRPAVKQTSVEIATWNHKPCGTDFTDDISRNAPRLGTSRRSRRQRRV